jgi:hypothetical protein
VGSIPIARSTRFINRRFLHFGRSRTGHFHVAYVLPAT